ncbi:AAA family ATPase [Microbacterium soli]|uniref:CobQ/CobB/MinD/ParA nucleotide binding domain-containing protein n=1 Tax=Microbacterium soli TaxID=446075 RepID=A0ABP7NE63_9MICO
MTPKNTVDPEGDDSLGVLDDTASSDTIPIGPLGSTEQVSVTLPTGGEDDDLVDDEVVGGEVVADLIIDTSAVADEDTVARISRETPEIVIELPAEDLPQAAPAEPEPVIEVEPETAPMTESARSVDPAPSAIVDAEVVPATDAVPTSAGSTSSAGGRPTATSRPTRKPATKARAKASAGESAQRKADARPGADAARKSDDGAVPTAVVGSREAAEPVSAVASAAAARTDAGPEPTSDENPPEGSELAQLESVVAATKASLREAMSPTRPDPRNEARPVTTGIEEENSPVHTEDAASAGRPATDADHPTPAPVRAASELTLTAKRLDDLGDSGRESADLLTADRLLDPSRLSRPEPEGAWSHLLYTLSRGRINIGDGRRARERKALTARIAAPMTGDARFVPVLSRKGGVGKTTVTVLLGMALADAREDRVIAVDANPDRGTLAERVGGSHTRSVRDLVRAQHDIRGFHDISALVARDHTRLDVLASDADPRVSEAFGDADYRDVAAVAAQYYSLVLTDSGTGIVHSVMGATLDLADRIIVVSGLSVDEARLASETLTWLESNGYAQLARDAIVVLNQSTPGMPLVRLGELESHFSTRAAQVLRIPYDPQIAGGGPIHYAGLRPETRLAAREIAAALVEGLRAKAA